MDKRVIDRYEIRIAHKFEKRTFAKILKQIATEIELFASHIIIFRIKNESETRISCESNAR